jgi:Uma2 family endonuclease
VSIPDWYKSFPEVMTEEEYEALPEEVARRIEVVHGHVIRCQSPSPEHNRIARRLANAIERAFSPSGPCLRADTDIDVILWRVPSFTFRRPDVAVYECLEVPGIKPPASRTRLVAEITSPSTRQEDLVDKLAQYANAGIPVYLVVILDEKFRIVSIREFHLDAAAGCYRMHREHQRTLDLDHPVKLSVPVAELER